MDDRSRKSAGFSLVETFLVVTLTAAIATVALVATSTVLRSGSQARTNSVESHDVDQLSTLFSRDISSSPRARDRYELDPDFEDPCFATTVETNVLTIRLAQRLGGEIVTTYNYSSADGSGRLDRETCTRDADGQILERSSLNVADNVADKAGVQVVLEPAVGDVDNVIMTLLSTDGRRSTVRGATRVDAEPLPGAPGSVGDGYMIVPAGDRAYNVFHHQPAQVVCVFKADGSNCFPETIGYHFTTTPRAVAKSIPAPGDPIVWVGMRSMTAWDKATNRIWVAGVLGVYGDTVPGQEAGFACLDLSASPPIGCDQAWIPTGTMVTTPTNSSSTGYEAYLNYLAVGSDPTLRRLYAIDQNFAITCLDMAAGTLCADWQSTDNALPLRPADLWWGVGSALLVPGTTSIVMTGFTWSNEDYMTCIDAVTGARCSGWSAEPERIPNDTTDGETFGIPFASIERGTAPEERDVCFFQARRVDWLALEPNTLDLSCVAVADGRSVPEPTGIRSTFPTDTQLAPGDSQMGDRALSADGRLVMAWSHDAGRTDTWTCYSFELDGACTGWNGGIDFTGAAFDYGYSAALDDSRADCIWLLGDAGIRRYIDLDNGWACVP